MIGTVALIMASFFNSPVPNYLHVACCLQDLMPKVQHGRYYPNFPPPAGAKKGGEKCLKE